MIKSNEEDGGELELIEADDLIIDSLSAKV